MGRVSEIYLTYTYKRMKNRCKERTLCFLQSRLSVTLWLKTESLLDTKQTVCECRVVKCSRILHPTFIKRQLARETIGRRYSKNHWLPSDVLLGVTWWLKLSCSAVTCAEVTLVTLQQSSRQNHCKKCLYNWIDFFKFLQIEAESLRMFYHSGLLLVPISCNR